MNKTLKRALSIGLCAGMTISTAALSACKQPLDTETRPLQLSTAALDGNFNPFFYTSLTDGNMVSNTQLPLVTGDEKGRIVCGENEACVALDQKKTMYDKDGKVMAKDGDVNGKTEYEYIIKNGIKFSDGADLTIKDVLFNLYLYLDPAYTGSTTLYSVDIQGLNAYRMQDPRALDGSLADTDESFRGDAQDKMNNLIEWAQNQGVYGNTSEDDLPEGMKDDLKVVRAKFDEEIKSDWTAIDAGWYESYKNSHRFKSTWEAYLFQEGIISVQTKQNANGSYSQIYDDTNGNGKRDDGELYYTTLDPNQEGANKGTVEHQHIIDEVNNYVSANLQKYMTDKKVSEEAATAALQREVCLDLVYRTYTNRQSIDDVLTYWSTGNEVFNEFIGQARTKKYEDLRGDDGSLLVKTISGITTYKTTQDFSGKALGEEHDVLKITINGIDPKAEYNFALSIAPLHYYSGTYQNVNYVAEANGVDKFGVRLGDKSFYDNVVQTQEKNGLPVGAGPYKASAQHEGDTVTRSTFYDGSIVYFERNEYFERVGSGIENAKIKRINYKSMKDDQIVSNLKTGEIDYGEPNATPGNKNEVRSIDNLQSDTYETGGYGYVGINPKFIPEREVRQAIMKAMDVNLIIKNYYGSGLATRIYRPESTTSWAYPNVGEYPSIAYTTVNKEITDLVESAGYRKGSDGIYAKGGKRLEFTFTIAGESTDHPAYAMFLDAEARLNGLGFKITTGPNIQALRLMNSGSLAVWAAAYSSASDPDLYQIYHKDSKATSVNNWNYSGILNDSTGKFSREKTIVEDLSKNIEAARETLDQDERTVIYAQCFDQIMDLAVILPTYQRSDLYAFNKNVIDAKSLNIENCSWRMGPISKIWEVNYV